MPTYNYQCEQKHKTEIVHPINDDPEVLCQECQGLMSRLPSVVTATFSGSGFYSTDKNA